MNTLPTSANLSPESFQPTNKSRRVWWGLGAVVVIAAAVLLVIFNGRMLTGKSSPNHAEQSPNNPAAPTVVEAVHPQSGGIDRVCIQPGSVEPFESADLYAKVSGFLLTTVDIGTRVKEGELLAQLSVPEYEKQVKKDTASVEHQESNKKQMEAHLLAAEAEAKASKQMRSFKPKSKRRVRRRICRTGPSPWNASNCSSRTSRSTPSF